MDYDTSRTIEADVRAVWDVLIDVERWPSWTSSMRSVRRRGGGPLALGSEVQVKQPKMPSTVWRVTDFQPRRSFTWVARSGGVTTFGFHRLVPEPGGFVTARLGIEQRGLLAPVLDLLLGARFRRYVDTEIEGLKRHCERHNG